MTRDPDRLCKVPRRIKQVARKFIHRAPVTPKEHRRLVRWVHARLRDIGAAPMRQLPDGRFWLFDVWHT